MAQAATILFWLSFLGVLAASVIFAYELLLKRNIRVKPQWVSIASFVALFASIGFNSAVKGGTPFTGDNILVLAAWGLLIIYFIFEYLTKMKNFGIIMVPIATVLLGWAQFVGSRTSIAPNYDQLTAQMDATGIVIHVTLIVFANVLFLVGAASSGLYLYQSRMLKRNATNLLSRRLPSLLSLEKLSSRAIIVALPIYFSAQMFGIIRAISIDVAGWWADIRVVVSGLVIIVFIGYLVLFQRNKTSGQTTAVLALIGGLIVIILMILARVYPYGFHVFGVL